MRTVTLKSPRTMIARQNIATKRKCLRHLAELCKGLAKPRRQSKGRPETATGGQPFRIQSISTAQNGEGVR